MTEEDSKGRSGRSTLRPFDYRFFGRLRRIYGHVPLAIIGLIIAKPGATSTLIGTVIVLIGVLIRMWASGFLEKGGKLCVDGPYRYVRHPLYLGSFVAAVGFAVMMNVIWGWVIIVPLFVALYAIQVLDEERNLRSRYGEVHEQYARSVPAVFPIPGRKGIARGRRWTMSRVLANREQWHVLVTLGLAALFYLRAWTR